MSEAPTPDRILPSGLTAPPKQHGDDKRAAAATASAVNEAETEKVVDKLTSISIAGADKKPAAINAAALKASVSANKPKVSITFSSNGHG